MNSEELLDFIRILCEDVQENRLSAEDLQENLEDGFGGNGDDAFYAGIKEGNASLGASIIRLITENQ